MNPKEALIEVLSQIEVRIPMDGPAKGMVLADKMADAILYGLSREGFAITPLPSD